MNLLGYICISCLLAADSGKIERLICLAADYRQVEKAVMLLRDPDPTVMRIPCIPPLRAEDFRKIATSSPYGLRLHPILKEYKHHAGIDLPGKFGQEVYATADGIVLATGQNEGIGKYVRLQHAFGFTTVYGHLSGINVSASDSVHIGQAIGRVGSTGRSTGCHLHYGIRKNGREQDPLPYCYLYLRWRKMSIREGKKTMRARKNPDAAEVAKNQAIKQ